MALKGPMLHAMGCFGVALFDAVKLRYLALEDPLLHALGDPSWCHTIHWKPLEVTRDHWKQTYLVEQIKSEEG